MKRLLLISLSCLVFFALAWASAAARQSSQESTTATKRNLDQQKRQPVKERRGTIKGRVVADGGRPLAHVGVNVSPSGAQRVNNRTVGTDEEGRFEVDDLPPAAYSVMAYVPGYVVAPAGPNEKKTYRIGETATITMIKGGVIAGMVKTAAGEPLIAAPVRALRVKDGDGRPTRSQSFARDRQTDDRGFYRLYGLEPGTYVVAAGGTTSFYSGYNKFGEDVPTYYPSSTRDTAVEVIVPAGQEVAGIDISYRGEKGYAVSGTLAGAPPPANSGFSVYLLNATTGFLESTASVNYNDRRSFACYGVPDGDYYLVAESFSWQSEKDFSASHIRRLSVKGADVTGLEIALTPMASVAGRILVEPLTATTARAKCESKREAVVEEAMVMFLRESRGELTTPGWLRGSVQAGADEKGAFAAYRLNADRYRLEVNLPSDNWYVKTVALGASANDAVTKGMAVKAGEKIENLLITIAEGAGAISGKLVAASETEKLPSRVRVLAVPAERERADDLLRYAQVEAQGDGSFALANLAPGKYWLVSREVGADEANDLSPRPVYWEAAGRLALRQEAEAANVSMDLAVCQQVREHRLKHGGKAVKRP